MPTLDFNWRAISKLSGTNLKHAAFKTIQDASLAIQLADKDDPSLLEIVPRLTELVVNNQDELGCYRELISSLARSTGLWNYIDVGVADISDIIIAEAATAPELGHITFHREQINALNVLLSGQNLILSAPTSFGKSLLVDALLATDRYKRIAVVLPTIALLDEFRRRFRDRFADKFNIVMHQSEESTDAPTIFLGTQERLIHRRDLNNLDLTVVDEFYKLDPDRRDNRSVTLNATVYQLLKRSRQFFFLGPNIDSVMTSGDARWNFEFLKTRFSTVAIDTLDLQHSKDKYDRLVDEVCKRQNWPTLVFVSSPNRANRLAIDLSQKMHLSDEAVAFARWLTLNIGANNVLSKVVERGFGIHHGRVPRAIAAQMARLFNKLKLPVLFCTSTLIEGVNTAAKTVMIYDKEINRRHYDFFTFSNIRGRAGRLGQHYVGQVMVFNEIPEHTELEVSPTMFSDDDGLPDDYIVHIDEPDRSQRSNGRFRFYKDQLNLEDDDLKLASSIGLETAVALKERVADSLNQGSYLVWDNRPRWPEIVAVCEVICSIQHVANFGAVSVRQLATLINKLRNADTLRQFLLEQDDTHQGSSENRDNIFKFLRACEYGLPQNFTVVELFVRQIAPQADYSFFVSGMSSWFKPNILKELEEEGIPIQITEKYDVFGDTKATLKQRLSEELENPNTDLSRFEIEWLQDAL